MKWSEAMDPIVRRRARAKADEQEAIARLVMVCGKEMAARWVAWATTAPGRTLRAAYEYASAGHQCPTPMESE